MEALIEQLLKLSVSQPIIFLFEDAHWSDPPIRSSVTSQRMDYQPAGSCGTCQNCCTTHWMPPLERQSCPLLGAEGCTVYGGLYWDYFNCGRYPSTPPDTLAYDCPRFERPVHIPDALPSELELEQLSRRS